MKKFELKMELYDEKIKQKAMKYVCGFTGVDSVTVDMKDKKLTVTGDIDPVKVTVKLRKLCRTDLVSLDPVPEKKNKDDGAKKDDNSNKKDNDQKLPPYFYYPPCNYQQPSYILWS